MQSLSSAGTKTQLALIHTNLNDCRNEDEYFLALVCFFTHEELQKWWPLIGAQSHLWLRCELQSFDGGQ